MHFDNEIAEHFIPVAYDELFDDAMKYFAARQDNIEEYRRFSLLLQQIYHARFFTDLQQLKRLYLPFNPDADTLTRLHYTPDEYEAMKVSLTEQIHPLLDDANYEELTEEALNKAMARTSPYGVEVSVDFGDFDDISLFYRGEAYKYEDKRRWQTLFLRKESIRVNIYRRLFLLLKPKTLMQRAGEIAREDGKDLEKVIRQLRRENRILIESEKSERIFIKLFKDIPHPDLEMLFPNTKVRMTMYDKLKIGVTGGGGAIGGAITLIGKIGSVIEPFSFIMAVGAFAGVLWRQIKTVFTHRTRYMAALAKNLYYYNLDNNVGALTYMIDMAEREESKEALLAYIFIVENNGVFKRKDLDKAIETHMLAIYGLPMDFEVNDGVAKLLELKLIEEKETRLHAVSPNEAISRLQISWSGLAESPGKSRH